MSIPLEPSEMYTLLEYMPKKIAGIVQDMKSRRGECNLHHDAKNSKEGIELRSRYMTICQEQGTEMNRKYYDFLHTEAANTALPESDHDSDDEKATDQAISAIGINTGVNNSMTPTEIAQAGEKM
jgi:hypothetical protein